MTFVACEKSTDFNDDGKFDIADATFLLNRLFVSVNEDLPGPFSCGQDTTQDALSCVNFVCQ